VETNRNSHSGACLLAVRHRARGLLAPCGSLRSICPYAYWFARCPLLGFPLIILNPRSALLGQNASQSLFAVHSLSCLHTRPAYIIQVASASTLKVTHKVGPFRPAFDARN